MSEYDIELVQVDSLTVVSRRVERPAPVEILSGPQAFDVAELIDGNAPAIFAAIPDLSDEALLELEQREQAGKTRKGVMAAILAEREARGV